MTPSSSGCSRRSTTRPTRAAVTAERRLLAALEAGCSAPVGAYATGQAGHRTGCGLEASSSAPGRQIRSLALLDAARG